MKHLLNRSAVMLAMITIPLLAWAELVEMSDDEMSEVYVKGAIPSAATGKGGIDPEDLDAIREQIAAKKNVDDYLIDNLSTFIYNTELDFREEFILNPERLTIELQNEILKRELQSSPLNPAIP